MRQIKALLLLISASVPAAAAPPCQLCAPGETKAEERPRIPLRVEVQTALDFSRVTVQSDQGGEVVVDARSGVRQLHGGLRDLGGMAVRGTARIVGEPMAAVRIDLPRRVTLRATSGATADVYDLETDLSADPRIGADGALTFSFGGRLAVKPGLAGTLRGSIPIIAEYQ